MLNDPQNFGYLDDLLERLPENIPYLDRETAALINGRRSLLLLTTPKSGTHWLLYLIANYASQLREPGAERVTYGGLGRIATKRERVLSGKERVRNFRDKLLPEHGIDHLVYQHPLVRRLGVNVSEHLGPKLLAYRNPLDFIVSCYYYYFEFRGNKSEQAGHPRDLIPGYTRYWSVCWRFFDEIVLPNGRAALISYDALKADTTAEMMRAFGELDVALDGVALNAAIPLSSIELAREDEERRGSSLVARLDSGRFTRDGSVGQWRSHFDAHDITNIAKVLSTCSVDPAAVLPYDALELAGWG